MNEENNCPIPKKTWVDALHDFFFFMLKKENKDIKENFFKAISRSIQIFATGVSLGVVYYFFRIGG